MCGLYFRLSRNGSVSAEFARTTDRAVDAMRRRGPDNRRISIEDGYVLGHVRLSILDVASRAHQPMWHEDDRHVLVYNGEIYNFRQLRRDLEGKVPPFRTTSDTEVLLKACVHLGIDETLHRVTGMFAFVLYDKVAEKGIAARDAFGQKPLFYCAEGGLFFASSLPSLLEATGRSSPDLDAYQIFLATRGIVEPHRTFFDHVFALPAGHYMTFDRAGQSIRPYFGVSDLVEGEELARAGDKNKHDVLGDLDAILERSIERHLVSDVPVGVLLSGGVDSSLVHHYARQKVPDLTVFTKVSPGIETIPLSIVPRILAREPATAVLSLQHRERYIRELDGFIAWCGFPPPWGGGPPMHNLCAEARDRGVKVLLGGDCADEYFAGYESYHRLFNGYDGNALHLGEQLGLNHTDIPRFRPLALDGYRDFQIDVRRRILDRLSFLKSPRERFMHACLLQDTLIFLQSCVLPHSDAYAMMASVELRNPLLDPELVRYAVNLPVRWRYFQKGSSYRLKRALRDLAIQHFGTFIDARKEGTRNFSVATSQPKYWNLNNFSLNALFPIPADLSAKEMFRVLCLELFHRRFVLGKPGVSPDLMTPEGKSAILPSHEFATLERT